MRVGIREQFGILQLLTTGLALAVLAIAAWFTNRGYVLEQRSSRLALTASLKAAQLTSNIELMESHVRSASTRLALQAALQRYNHGNNTEANWVRTRDDLATVFQGGGQNALLLQAKIFAKNGTGVAGPNTTLVEATGSDTLHSIQLPGRREDGSNIYLGDKDGGYPSSLYPNFTYWAEKADGTDVPVTVDGQKMDQTQVLLLGPMLINSTYSLLSITLPVMNNTAPTDLLGWMTIVLDGRLILNVISAHEGLDNSGVAMLIAPDTSTNKFSPDVYQPGTDEDSGNDGVSVIFRVPPTEGVNTNDRHASHVYGSANPPFTFGEFEAVHYGYSSNISARDSADSAITTRNEAGAKVSVGYARPDVTIVDWLLMVEQSHDEVWAPINKLRNILLACVFGVLALVLIITIPIAHYAVAPIRNLRDATRQTVTPIGFDHPSSQSPGSSLRSLALDDHASEVTEKAGLFGALQRFAGRMRTDGADDKDQGPPRAFRVPGKVKERRHFIQDELTDLAHTYNEMGDELMIQYEKLEDRVAQRTAELHESMKAAEAANESKTLFIANISHELKTPLNGIMGMTMVCMQEEDTTKLKHSLGVIYKSGDLLLHLLTDLLTFSKNQVGQQLQLSEKEFRLTEVTSQIRVIFDRQAKDSGIDLLIKYEGPSDANTNESTGLVDPKRELAPFGLGKVKNMVLWGDYYRILQVVINLVSNSLKFTPNGGSVVLIIRCMGDSDVMFSRHASRQESRNSRNRSRLDSSSNNSAVGPRVMDTANEINPLGKGSVLSQIIAGDRSSSPPPGRMLEFQFEVQDNGPGIPENLHQRIFEPFVQADLGLSKKFGGTGLGLSICSQLATLMRGSMDLQSELGKGSTFTMTVPLRYVTSRHDSTSASSVGTISRRNSLDVGAVSKVLSEDNVSIRSFRSAHSATAIGPVVFDEDTKPRLVGLSQPFFASNTPLESPGSQQKAIERVVTEALARTDKIRVLVAEDNKTNQEVVLRMLKLEMIYDVTVAKDGQEAFDLVKESMENHTPFHLIFMDVQMPNLDGLESTRLIRKSGYAAPIVALTAYSEESNVKECLASGMDYFLSKPIKRPQLKHVLKTYCPPIQEEEESSPASLDTNQENISPMTKDVPAAHTGPPAGAAETAPDVGAKM